MTMQGKSCFIKPYLTIFLILIGNLCFAQAQLDRGLAQLRQSDFGNIYSVKDSVVNQQQEAIPKLIELLRDTSFIKLTNTADLIYPGANKFYEHGWIVGYDLDWVALRAAWLLEEITFQDFGYQKGVVTEQDLLALHERKYTSYSQKGFHAVDFRTKVPKEKLKIYRLMLADSVTIWWNRNKLTWSRFAALKESLSSSDEKRQALALHYLRFDRTQCYGLSLVTYEGELKPLILKISNSNNREANQARYLLDDKEYYWFKLKRGVD
jgi:hypothetical protein